MKKSAHVVLCISLAAGISGCATVLPMTPTGAKVRQITAATAKTCRFIQVAQFSTTLYGMGKDPGLVETTGENGLRNAVAALGGNAFVPLSSHADWFLGHVSYSGNAYSCNF